jgi:hypothetical protein
MNINTQWYTSDCRVIQWTFATYWTWDDYLVSFDRLCRLATSVPHRVDVVAEIDYTTMLPRGAISAYKTTADHLPLNVRSIALVGANVWTRAMITGLRCINTRLGDKVFFTDTREQALQLICESCHRTPQLSTLDYASQHASSELSR